MYCVKCGAIVPQQGEACPRCATPVLRTATEARGKGKGGARPGQAAPGGSWTQRAEAWPGQEPVAGHQEGKVTGAGGPAQAVPLGVPVVGAAIGDLARPAGFWIRLLARLIDGLVFSILFGVIFLSIVPSSWLDLEMVMKKTMLNPTAFEAELAQVLGVASALNLASLLVQVLYEVVAHAVWGCTIGKWVLGLRVVGHEGRRISLVRSFIRWIGYIVASIPFLIGLIWAAFDGRKQGLHDKIAGSYVVHRV